MGSTDAASSMDPNQYAAYVARYDITKIAKIRLPWSLKDRGDTGNVLPVIKPAHIVALTVWNGDGDD